jgi:SAM-dependent methyltransferase
VSTAAVNGPRVRWLLVAALVLASTVLQAAAAPAQSPRREAHSALEAFNEWRAQPANAALSWDDTLTRYRRHLVEQGLSPDQVDRTLRLALAHDEGSLYDKVYAGVAEFRAEPNRLLVEAVAQRRPGKALDVGMGQGRNALHLAAQGWTVTGFDVSTVGLAQARKTAAARGLTVDAVHASDEEFPFGRHQWDLIAILYAIEKRSVFRAKEALRPGGLVVVEGAHREASGGEWEFESNELLRIFEGFRILKYEELVGAYDWAPGKPVRMVRLVAEKPR